MILDPHETSRFYQIWFPLLHYANDRLHLVHALPAHPEDGSIAANDAYKVSSGMWAHDELRHAFIAENPFDLPPQDLALVQSWDHRVAGDFYVFRHLKKYSVFIGQGSPARVYGVLGLVSPIEDVLPMPPPAMVRAVLLPFDGRITYDGLLSSYNIYFGSGIRGSLNDTYRAAKERGRIITSLGEDSAPADVGQLRKEIEGRNAKLLTAFRRDLSGSNLSLKMIEQHTASIATFGESYLLEQSPPRGLIDTTVDDIDAYIRANPRAASPVSFKRFARFMRDTGRMDWSVAEQILARLK